MFRRDPYTLKDGRYWSDGVIIGTGSFAYVTKGTDRLTNQEVAIKILSKSWEDRANLNPQYLNQLQAEILIMKKIEHNHIVRLYDVDKLNGSTCLIMEYCSDGNLDDLLKKNSGKISESMAKKFMLHLALGLKELQRNDVVHRDLKPENLLLSTDLETKELILKIADFGLAKSLTQEMRMAQTKCGTPHFMAPEIYQNMVYSFKADLWSAGVILFHMLTGKYLITQNLQQYWDPSFNPFNPDVPELSGISANCRDLMIKLLQVNPSSRITCDELCIHPFIIDVSSSQKPSNMMLWDAYVAADMPVTDLSPSVSINSRRRRIKMDDLYKSIKELSELADQLVEKGRSKESFAIYAQLLSELKSAIQFSDSYLTEKLLSAFENIKNKATQLRSSVSPKDVVDNPTAIILNHVLKKGKKGAKAELQSNWIQAVDRYRSGLFCLNFLEQHLKTNGTQVEQAIVLQYAKQFQERLLASERKLSDYNSSGSTIPRTSSIRNM